MLSHFKDISTKKIIVAGLLLAMGAVSVVWAQSVVVNISGYLWAADTRDVSNETGVGWIATDCSVASNSGGDACSQSDFGIQINNSDKVSGYIWSGNIGWLRFGNLGGCPSGNCAARIVESGNKYEMMGWARACSVFASGCSGPLKDDIYRGGWDGWVSLNCANHGGCGASNYKVKINSDGSIPNDAFAWGGDIIGAVAFGSVQMQCSVSTSKCADDGRNGIITTNALCQEEFEPCPAGTVCRSARCIRITADDINAEIVFGTDIVRIGESTTVGWNFLNTPPENTECRVESATGHKVNTNGGDSEVVRAGEIEYILYCSVNGGDEFEEDKKSLRAVPSVQES